MKEKCEYCKPNDPCFACMIEETLEKKNKQTQKTKKDMKEFKKTKEGTISLMDMVKEKEKLLT